jgi:type I site-specific restriction endonuclease
MTNSNDSEHSKEPDSTIEVTPLRLYQTEIISKIEQTVNNNGKLLISLAVGNGSTATIGLAINSLFRKNVIRRAIVVTPTCE